MIEPISRPPGPAAVASAPPPTIAPIICAPTPPPTIPAIVLPTAPKLYCFSAEPAMFPPTAPAISCMISLTVPPHILTSSRCSPLIRCWSTALGGARYEKGQQNLRDRATNRGFPEQALASRTLGQ